MAEDAELAPVAADQQHGGGVGEQGEDADHAHCGRVQRQGQRGGGRFHAQRHTDQQPGTEDEAQRAHQHHLADLRQVESGAAVAAQTHRAAGQCRKAHRLPQGVGEEGGDANARRMHADTAAAQTDGIEADQAGVAGQAQQHGQRDLRAGQLVEGFADGTVAVLVELVGQPVQGQRQDQQRDDDGQDPLPCRGVRSGGGVVGWGHRRKNATAGGRGVST